MKVRVTQLDGKLPNLALMRLAAWHRECGDDVHWERGTTRRLEEPEYDRVYGSAIFSTSAKAVALFRSQFPKAIVGGSGGNPVIGPAVRTECYVPTQFRGLDYSGFPRFTATLGYTSRGCRSKCKFCVVPSQEGEIYSAASIAQLWRGDPFPRHLHLLDNDFFGNPNWRSVVREIVNGGFRVCINQGVNVRRITDEAAEAVVAMITRDTNFNRRRLYVAWDNIGDERVFFQGIDRLERAGWKPSWTMAYMLVGFDRRETWERVQYRFDKMTDRGIEPYPMVFGGDQRTPRSPMYPRLKRWQRYVRTGKWRTMPFADYSTRRDHTPLPQLFPTPLNKAPNDG